MNQDAIFRPVLVAGFLAVLLITLYHRIKAGASREKLDRRQEGAFILATLRPAGLMLWLGVIVYMIHPAWMAWSSVPLPAWLRWTGAGICALAVGLLTWTLRSLGRNLTDTVVTRQDHTLVRSPAGLESRGCRHRSPDCRGAAGGSGSDRHRIRSPGCPRSCC